MFECDAQSKMCRKSTEIEQEDVCNVKHVGNNAVMVDNIPCGR